MSRMDNVGAILEELNNNREVNEGLLKKKYNVEYHIGVGDDRVDKSKVISADSVDDAKEIAQKGIGDNGSVDRITLVKKHIGHTERTTVEYSDDGHSIKTHRDTKNPKLGYKLKKAEKMGKFKKR